MTIAEDYFMLPPNWDSTLRTIFGFTTDIRRSITGYEARNNLLEYPMRKQEYIIDYMSTGERNYALGKLYDGAQKLWGIPLWGFSSPLTAQASSGQPVMSVDTDINFFEDGQLVCVFNEYDDYEIELILSSTSSSITLSGNLVNTWPTGSLVYPMLQGYIEPQNTMSQKSSIYGGVGIKQREVYDDSITRLLGSHTYGSHQGYVVFNTEPDWSSGVQLNILKRVHKLKGLALEYVKSYQNEGDLILKFDHLLTSRTELYELVSLFNAMRGKWRQFWVPTWTKDIVITAEIGASDTDISIEDIDYSSIWSGNITAGRWLYLQLPNGTEIIRKIIGWPSSTVLSLASSLGVDVSLAELGYSVCSFLLPSRFDADELVVEHLTTVASTTKINTHSLPDDTMTTTTTTTTV